MKKYFLILSLISLFIIITLSYTLNPSSDKKETEIEPDNIFNVELMEQDYLSKRPYFEVLDRFIFLSKNDEHINLALAMYNRQTGKRTYVAILTHYGSTTLDLAAANEPFQFAEDSPFLVSSEPDTIVLQLINFETEQIFHFTLIHEYMADDNMVNTKVIAEPQD